MITTNENLRIPVKIVSAVDNTELSLSAGVVLTNADRLDRLEARLRDLERLADLTESFLKLDAEPKADAGLSVRTAINLLGEQLKLVRS